LGKSKKIKSKYKSKRGKIKTKFQKAKGKRQNFKKRKFQLVVWLPSPKERGWG
jgi:hypothetical protein